MSGGSGPYPVTASRNDRPGTYEVASQGRDASGSASSTCAVNRPCTRCAAATSCRNLARNCSSPPNSARTILIATCRPPGVRAR